MEETTHKYLLELRLISNIPEDGQLNTIGRNLSIYNWSLFNWVSRVINGDGRHKTILALKQTYINSNKFADELLKAVASESSNPENMSNDMMPLLISFTERLCESLVGVKNLRYRYKDDNSISVQLQHIESDIIIPRLDKLIRVIPPDLQSKSPILLNHLSPLPKPLDNLDLDLR